MPKKSPKPTSHLEQLVGKTRRTGEVPKNNKRFQYGEVLSFPKDSHRMTITPVIKRSLPPDLADFMDSIEGTDLYYNLLAGEPGQEAEDKFPGTIEDIIGRIDDYYMEWIVGAASPSGPQYRPKQSRRAVEQKLGHPDIMPRKGQHTNLYGIYDDISEFYTVYPGGYEKMIKDTKSGKLTMQPLSGGRLAVWGQKIRRWE